MTFFLRLEMVYGVSCVHWPGIHMCLDNFSWKVSSLSGSVGLQDTLARKEWHIRMFCDHKILLNLILNHADSLIHSIGKTSLSVHDVTLFLLKINHIVLV